MVRDLNFKMDFSLFKKEFCSVYMFLLTFFNTVVNTHMTVGDSSHAFIQAKSNGVHLIGVEDGLEVLMHQDMHISNLHEDLRLDDDAFATSTYLKFVPPQLDFKEKHLGVPHQEKVTLLNTDPNRTIHLTSISGNTLHFHSSFFQDKTIPPKGNTSFAVVLLARMEGPLSSTLYIHTSEGTYRYQVAGTGVRSPYRLQPLGGLRLPLNAVFQPLVWLHNPHQHPIQVMEVYSSGTELHLELPTGELEGPKTLWEVPPYCTKPVIRARFEAVSQSNHTAYIRLKLKHSDEVLVVPVEVEVSDQGGLYPLVPVLDFGLGGSLHKPRSLKLQLANSLKKTLKVVGVGVTTPNRAVTVDFEPIKVPPGAEPVTVANLTFDWKTGFETQHTSGHVWVKTRGSTNKLLIPYTAGVLEGGLVSSPPSVEVRKIEMSMLPRTVTVVNQFRIPVAINNATLPEPASRLFKIINFEPVVLAAGKSLGIMSLVMRDNCNYSCEALKLDSSLILATNVSDVFITLRSYDGTLSLVFPYEGADLGVVDLGLLSTNTVHTFRFGLWNNNPVPVELLAITTSSLLLRPHILGVFRGNTTLFIASYLQGNITDERVIPPGGMGIVQITAQAHKSEHKLNAQLSISTTFEVFLMGMKATYAPGSLDIVPKELVLEDCFPGKICRHQLKVQSTFNRPMTAVGVKTVPPDPRLTFTPSQTGLDILPSTSNYIGELTWEPWRGGCGASCYLGLPLNTTSGTQWVYTDVLPPSTADSDLILLRERYQRLANLTSRGTVEQWEDITLRLYTNELRQQFFQARVRLTWPKLGNTTRLVFPLTQVTNTTLLRLKLHNPASHLILVQLVLEWAYPQPKRLIDSFPTSFRPHCGRDCFQSSPKEFFIFQDFSGSQERLGTLNTTLAPGESYEITVGYNPGNAGLSRSLLLIRNNLTVIEVLELEGKAAFAQFKFGNRRPGQDSPLLFEIADRHLRDCYMERSKKYPTPNLTVKRSFTARNVGDLPIYVHGFSINGLECEGYGFAVLNCSPFLLPPNATRKVDIAFSPDFTLSKVTRTLRLATTLGSDVNYTMVTTLPPYFLASCASVLGRPSWEPLLYYSSVSFMLFLLFCVLAAAFFESDRILKCALLTLSRERTVTPLDLRQVGAGVLKELASQRKSESDVNDGMEKYKMKETPLASSSDTPGWITGLSADDRQYEQAQQESSPPPRQEEPEKEPVPKVKRRMGKRNSDSEAQEVAAVSKKKDKHSSNGWCNVFNRHAAVEKTKSKTLPLAPILPEPVKPSKASPETKKEEQKKEEKDRKRGKFKRSKETEEETNSNMTDSSNDTEKEGKEKEVKYEKKARVSKPKIRDEVSDECKSVHSRTIWRMGAKPLRSSTVESSVWKQPQPEPEPEREPLRTIEISKSRGKNTNLRREKDKPSARRVAEVHNLSLNDLAVSGTAATEVPCPPAPPSCWEQRSFSDVVASENPVLYSNIVQAKPSSSLYTNGKEKPSATLGPIGSKKPTSTWTNSALAQKTYGYPAVGFMDLSEPDMLESEDVLPEDPEDRWEDQHAIMQMMHASSQSTWKVDNWTDSVWSPGRGELSSDLEEPSWGALLRASWSPLPWSPRPQPTTQPTTQHQLHQTPDYPSPGYTSDGLYTRPPPPPEQDPLEHVFDPFHSLGSIWSPKAANTWAAPGTQ